MSKSRKMLILLWIVLLAWAGNGSAQSKHFGLGINVVDFLKDYDIYDLMEEDIYELVKHPVLYGTVLMPKFRIEPEFSVWRYSRNYDEGADSYKTSSKSLVLHFGVGASYILRKTPKTITYAGLKLGIDILSSKSEHTSAYTAKTTTTRKRTNVNIGPCLGTEYFLTESLSLGGEFQIIYTFVGQEKTTLNGSESEAEGETSDSIMRSNGLVYLRWYF